MENKKDFTVLIEQDEDGVYLAKVPELEGCYTQGKNLEEVMDRIKEAVEVCLNSEEENFKPMKFIGIQKMQVNSVLTN